jgi:hypothetical protein
MEKAFNWSCIPTDNLWPKQHPNTAPATTNGDVAHLGLTVLNTRTSQEKNVRATTNDESVATANTDRAYDASELGYAGSGLKLRRLARLQECTQAQSQLSTKKD